MATRTINNVRLGIFVLAGLLFLVLLLYMIGKNQHLFGSNYHLKARFVNVQGLKAGHNVRYSGIEVGTVKSVTFLCDTLIEVDMLIENRMKQIIRRNAIVSIGTDGFVGNKVVNILPGKEAGDFAAENTVLASKKPVDTDEMLRTLFQTNQDVSAIAANLRVAVQNVRNSEALWALLNDKDVPATIKASVRDVRAATSLAAAMAADLREIVGGVKEGKGSLGAVLKDSSFAINLNGAIGKINAVALHADSLAMEMNEFVDAVTYEVNCGKGVANAFLRDSSLTQQVRLSLDNIQKGTEAFNQDMEALKHNFLFRGYFRKLEKQNQKAIEKSTVGKN